MNCSKIYMTDISTKQLKIKMFILQCTAFWVIKLGSSQFYSREDGEKKDY